jgi:Importin beta-related nuclear transport receptor
MWEERAQLKATLYQFALEHHQSVPNFIRNKLVKLIVDIARLDWPHFYPDFFSNILQVKGISERICIFPEFISVFVCV